MIVYPFPFYSNKTKINGTMFEWPKRCSYCTRSVCTDCNQLNFQLCSYGYCYIKVKENLIFGGLLIKDLNYSSPARNKLLKTDKKNATTKQWVINVANYIRENETKLIDEKVEEQQYTTFFLEQLTPKIQEGLSFVHDYKQINAQISQNINVIIETKYEGATFDEKLKNASQFERAIYESSKLLEEKMNVTKFLLNPGILEKTELCSSFRFHGILTKMIKIYEPKFHVKNIEIINEGKSFNEIKANSQAVSVIPHTFLDNASKYTPKNGRIKIYCQDIADQIKFSISSFGPRILENEKEKIFQPFFRGEEAKKIEEEGAGYGLYISQFIAINHLGTKIFVEQENRQTPKMGHWTTFSIQIPMFAKNCH